MRNKRIKTEVSEKIDKLTNSIEHKTSGNVFQTEFHKLTVRNQKEIKKKTWLFDWQTELTMNDRAVFKLTIKGKPNIIQGLISLKVATDHVFVYLVESAKFNKGKDKIHEGVLGNMFAFACKHSIESGKEGYVSFIAKSALIEHFEKSIGAKLFKGQRMYLEPADSMKLIKRYFNN